MRQAGRQALILGKMMSEHPIENQEGVILGKIIRHVAEGFEDDANAHAPDIGAFTELLSELAIGFEETGGIEFSEDQAHGLANAFSVLETAIKSLSEEAREGGHHNAAAKLEWAARLINGYTATLQECHLAQTGGSLSV